MHIFAHELADGLEHLLSAQSSISYASIAEKSQATFSKKQTDIKALAGIQDKDLYYTQSILVTTSWNKNDDVFDKSEVWAARNTPIHKPTNLEHNEGIIVGHITSNWPITDDGILIDQETPSENLPDKYHILTGSVIYTGYTEKELKDRSEKLIAEIEDGTKYVSMECFFKGFDYGLTNKSTGQFKVLGRNEETAFLTKHLRAYGGMGEYQEHKIGRVLRQITFSGKGFVDKPANPESIIFTKNNLQFDKKVADLELAREKNDNFTNIGVFSNQANLKETDMSLETQVAEMKEKIEAMAGCEAAVAEAQTLAGDLQNKNSELTTELTEVKAALVEKEEAAQKMLQNMKQKEEEMKKMKAELDAVTETLAVYKDKEAEMMKKEKKMKRMASLIETGLDSELATSTVEKFENLDDEAFESMAAVFAAMTKKKAQEVPMKKKASEDSVVDTEVLETAETEASLDLSVGGETVATEVENTRAALVDFVYNRLGKKLNKGE
jgi:hypothetical protein